MKKLIILGAALVMAAGLSMAQAGNVDKGKALFESPSLGGATTGKSCKSCHNRGKGLSKKLFKKKTFTIMGMKKNSLEEVVNVCIEKPLGGTAIDPKGQDMADIIAYMKKIAKSKRSRKIEGC